MNNKSKLILVGPINKGNVPMTGDTMKNQLFLKRFSEVFEKVIAVDTRQWKKRPWVILEMLARITLNINAKVVISANPQSSNSIIRNLRRLHLDKNLFYWVVGGSFHERVKDGDYDAENYKNVKAILVQGKSMVKTLNGCGLNNAIYVPNSKYIDFLPEKPTRKDDKTHFVFLSRLDEYKGCSDIIAAADILNKGGYEGKFDITFYGKTTDDISYFDRFCKAIESHSEISYKGLLNLRDSKNYNELASYDVMLFPTYWMGEGFPGIVIDAYIASLPIIATDRNLNKDVVEEGKTGWIIPTHSPEALAEKMKHAIEHPEEVKTMAKNCHDMAMKYDSREVLSEENLKKIGLL